MDEKVKKTKKNYSLNADSSSAERLLDIYIRASKGEVLNKSKLADKYGKDERSIQRSFKSLNDYLYNENKIDDQRLVFDEKSNGHILKRNKSQWLTKGEVLSVIKVLFESRAFTTSRLSSIITKLLLQTSSEDQKLIEEIVMSEQKNYKPVICNDQGEKCEDDTEKIWELSEYIKNKKIINMKYKKQNIQEDNENIINKIKSKKKSAENYEIQPVAVMFSEFYFYLLAYKFSDDRKTKDFRTFRVDRIISLEDTSDTFEEIYYSKKFSEGEFRKRISFMFAGELYKIKFKYEGALEPILDRFPTAEIKSKIQNDEGKFIYQIEAEVIGKGYEFWIKAYGDKITDVEERKMVVSS